MNDKHDFEDNLTEGMGERITPAAVSSGGYRDHLGRYLFAAHFVPGRTVVDLCCGNGYGSNLLLAAGAVSVTGIDIAAEAVATAREHYPGPEFEVGAVDAPLELGKYDVAVCFEGLEHVDDTDRLLRNMSAAGLALVSSPNGAFFDGGFSGNPHHRHEWTRKEFDELLGRYFSEVRMYFQWDHPDPLDLDRRPGTLARAVVPVAVKRWAARNRPADTPSGPGLQQAGDDRRNYRVQRTTARTLAGLLPGLRHGEPLNWLAVCRP